MNHISKKVAEELLRIKAVKLSPEQPFTWASGILSPIYCDNRLTLAYPELRTFLIQSFVEKAQQFGDFDVVAGVATAGIPHGALLAEKLGKPFVYVRDKAKSHGRQNQIEGLITSGQRVLVIEDLISTGGSSVVAVEALQAVGCEVVGTLAIFSYGFQKAVDAFAAVNCPFDTLTNYNELIPQAVALGYVSAENADTLQQWRIAPETWGKA